MPTHASDEAEIRRRIGRLVEAIRAMDLEGTMAIYAPNVVSFDLTPPLRYAGPEIKRKHWGGAFGMYQPPVGYEVRGLTITVGEDVAFAHSLKRVSGTRKDGSRSDFWLRGTTCYRKIDGNWLIAHDQVSVPF